ncbi:hypothetical protein [Rhizobium sp. SYY.PMSO]|uniref:hypothetical protein n=1 Tax=Rhizobium sp. SYY.PMSO TaxID=3382192 RepID=UPI00398FC9C0
MKFTSAMVLAAILLLPAIANARDFAPILYQKGNWRVIRGDNGPFEVCLAQYVLEGKVSLMFSKFRGIEEVYFGAPKAVKDDTVTIQFEGLLVGQDAISLDVRSRSSTTVLATTDSIPMLEMAMTASAMTVSFGTYSIKVPLNGGSKIFTTLDTCLTDPD